MKNSLENTVAEFDPLDSSIILQEERSYLIVDLVTSLQINCLREIIPYIPLESHAFCPNEHSFRHIISFPKHFSSRSVADKLTANGFPSARIALVVPDLEVFSFFTWFWMVFYKCYYIGLRVFDINFLATIRIWIWFDLNVLSFSSRYSMNLPSWGSKLSAVNQTDTSTFIHLFIVPFGTVFLCSAVLSRKKWMEIYSN